MCIYNVRIDDGVLERVKPHFSGTDAMRLWIERQLHRALVDYANRFDENEKCNLDKEEILQRIETLKRNSQGITGLCGILGNSSSDFSWDKLRDEVLSEKYSI